MDDAIENISAEIATLSNAELAELFSKSWIASAELYVKASVCMREMVRRGLDVGNIPPGTRAIMEKLADGQLLAALFMKLQGKPDYLIRRVANYSLAEQTRLLEQDHVRRVVMVEGQPDTQIVPLNRITKAEFNQVFSLTNVRDEAEQRQWMLNNQSPPTDPQVIPVRVDRKGHAMIIGGVRVTVSQLREYLKTLTGK